MGTRMKVTLGNKLSFAVVVTETLGVAWLLQRAEPGLLTSGRRVGRVALRLGRPQTVAWVATVKP